MEHPFRTMDAVHRKGEGCKEVGVGEIHKIGLSVMSKRKFEAFPQGGEVLYREVCHRSKELRSWAAWPKSKEVLGLWSPTERKAESQKIIRSSGKPVPKYL